MHSSWSMFLATDMKEGRRRIGACGAVSLADQAYTSRNTDFIVSGVLSNLS